MSNRTTGMVFLSLFTAILIALYVEPKGSGIGLFMILVAFIFLVAGVVCLLRGDGPARP